MKEYHVELTGPFSLYGGDNLFWDSELAHQSGIYIWTIEYQNNYFIDYIGETGQSFRERTMFHVNQTMAGNYAVLDIINVRKTGESIFLWNGQRRENTRNFMDLYVAFAPKIMDYISNINLFIAPIEIERRDRQLIEGNLAKHIYGQDKSVNRFFPIGIHYTLNRLPDEEQIKVFFQAPVHIVGLPEALLI